MTENTIANLRIAPINVRANTNPTTYLFGFFELDVAVDLYEKLLVAKVRKSVAIIDDYPSKGEQTIIFGDTIGSISANIPTEKLTTIQRRHGIC